MRNKCSYSACVGLSLDRSYVALPKLRCKVNFSRKGVVAHNHHQIKANCQQTGQNRADLATLQGEALLKSQAFPYRSFTILHGGVGLFHSSMDPRSLNAFFKDDSTIAVLVALGLDFLKVSQEDSNSAMTSADKLKVIFFCCRIGLLFLCSISLFSCLFIVLLPSALPISFSKTKGSGVFSLISNYPFN